MLPTNSYTTGPQSLNPLPELATSSLCLQAFAHACPSAWSPLPQLFSSHGCHLRSHL